MPGLSVYVTDDIYAYLLKRGKPSTISKIWIEDRYSEEVDEDVRTN